jgi:serine phosphatase RsbU (regulator of sigma subunit)
MVCSEIWGGNRPVHTPVYLPGLVGVLYSEPCHGRQGGDVHYMSVCGSGLLSRFCLADVVGHGESVAKVSTSLHRLMRRHMNTPDQRKVLRRLNDELIQIGESAMTSMAAASFYPPRGQLSVSYAGHPPGWFYSASTREWKRLTVATNDRSGGIQDAILAVVDNLRFTRTTVPTCEGDRFLLVTDGIAETPDGPDGHGAQFGEDGIERVLNETRDDDIHGQSEALLQAMAEHRGSPSASHDDVTFLLLECTEGRKGNALLSVLRNRLLRPSGNSRDWPELT